MNDVASLARMIEDVKSSRAVNMNDSGNIDHSAGTPSVKPSIRKEVDKLNECVRLSMKY